MTQCLSKICFVPFDIDFTGDIKNASQTKHRIDNHAHDRLYGRLGFQLQHAVNGRPGAGQVIKKVVHPGSHEVRRDVCVNCRNGLQNRSINVVIESTDTAVPRLKRIMRVGTQAGGTARECSKCSYE